MASLAVVLFIAEGVAVLGAEEPLEPGA